MPIALPQHPLLIYWLFNHEASGSVYDWMIFELQPPNMTLNVGRIL